MFSLSQTHVGTKNSLKINYLLNEVKNINLKNCTVVMSYRTCLNGNYCYVNETGNFSHQKHEKE